MKTVLKIHTYEFQFGIFLIGLTHAFGSYNFLKYKYLKNMWHNSWGFLFEILKIPIPLIDFHYFFAELKYRKYYDRVIDIYWEYFSGGISVYRYKISNYSFIRYWYSYIGQKNIQSFKKCIDFHLNRNFPYSTRKAKFKNIHSEFFINALV